MAQVKVSCNSVGGTLWACWGDPRDEDVCTDTDADLVISLNRQGESIGFEYFRFSRIERNDWRVKVHYDQAGRSLTVWFGDPVEQYACVDTGYGVNLIKDQRGDVIGVEKLNYALSATEDLQVEVAAFDAPEHREGIRSKSTQSAPTAIP